MSENPSYEELARRVAFLENELRQDRKNLGPVVDAMMSGLVLIDAQTHRIIDVNAAAASMINLEREQLIGRECFEFICPTCRGNCPITDLHQQVDHSERKLVCNDGSSVPVLKTVAVREIDGRQVLVESFIDISDRKETEQRLNEQEQFLRSILNALTFPFYVINTSDYTIALANEAAHFGLLSPGATCHQLTHHRSEPCSSNDHPCPINEIKKTGQPATFDHIHLDRHGEKRIVQVHGFPIFDDQGNISQVIEYSLDITEQRQGEMELKQAKEAAEIANLAKSQFLANMSHEIRTPMNGVIGLLDLLRTSQLTEQQRRYLELAKTSSLRMMDIVNDILDFSRIEAGHLTLTPAPCNLQELLGETLRILTVTAQQKGVELFYRIQRGVPNEVLGDAGRIRQILFNLIGNAIKFTDHGEVFVEVGATSASVPTQVILHFAVHDTGIGIPVEFHESIFNAFTQADGSMTRSYGGTGLGLAIASQLIGMMGGTINVDSVPGEGSTFHFTLILDRLAASSSTGQWEAREDIRDISILLAMNDDPARQQTAAMLREWLHSVETIDDGATLCQTLQQHKGDVVLFDDQLAGLDPVALQQCIDGLASRTPVALVRLIPANHKVNVAPLDIPVAATVGLPSSSGELLRAIHTAFAKLPRVPKTPEAPGAAETPKAPLVQTETPGPQVAESSVDHAAPPHQGATPKRILVAEDDYINRTLITTILEREGWEVTAVEDGRLAVEQQAGNNFACILMDVQMPEMDGFVATAAIRDQEKTTGKHIPIIALTAHAMKEDRDRCLAAGMDEYISKPVDYDKLTAILARFLPDD